MIRKHLEALARELYEWALPENPGLLNIAIALSAVEEAVRLLQNEVKQLAHRANRPPLGTVLVLWSPEQTGTPGCMSRSFAISHDQSIDTQIEPYFAGGIPIGAWVVAHGCQLVSVHVGNENEDLGPQPRGKLVRLRNPVPVGSRLHVTVKVDA